MVDAVDLHGTPIAIYREWLGSLPIAGLVVIQSGDQGTVVRPWLDEIDSDRPGPTVQGQTADERRVVRPWLDEIDSPTPVAQPAGVISRGGANEVDFNRPQGRVRVWLPDDMAAGDTISGSVIAEPTGRDQNQRRASNDTLDGYVIDVGGVRTPVSAGRFTFTVPPALSLITIRLLDGNRRIGDVSLNLPPTPARPQQVVIPRQGQAGRPLEIPGNFDGNSDNTSVRIGDQPGEVIAESPRQAVVWAPLEPAANTNITVSENGQTTQAPYRNIRIDLSSPRTNLRRGERTQVHVLVQGLGGITQPVSIRLETSSSVQMAGGNVQSIEIAPAAVGPGGVFQADRSLQATQSGPFSVTAILATPSGPP